MSDSRPVSIRPDVLHDFVSAIFRAVGMTDDDAGTLARSLVDADSYGVMTHGTARVGPYVRQLVSGQVNPRPHEEVVHERPAAVLIDADHGFGAPVGIRAVRTGMIKAKATGMCLVGVKNVAHFGAASFYTRYAAERGYLAIAMSSTSPSVVPHGGRTPRIGNSPMSFATPGTEHPELIMDMAQSMTSRGRIKLALERGEDIPDSWAIDADGNPTTNAQDALNGAVLPSGGHKGSAMSLVVEMLASGLTGARLSQDIQHAGFTSAKRSDEADDATKDVTVGNAYLVIDADVFGDEEDVRHRASRIARYVRESPAAPGVESVYAPGDLEDQHRAHVQQAGIELLPSTVDEFARLADRYGVPLPAGFDTRKPT